MQLPVEGFDLNAALPLRKLESAIERMNFSADKKALLIDLTRFTVKVGQTVLNLGRKLLSVVFDILRGHPNTSFGLVLGVGLAMLLGSIPIIGTLLAPIALPILVFLGVARGAWADFQTASWAGQFRAFETRLQALGV